MKRKFLISDVHGGYKAVKELFDRVNFDYENDELYFLGDILDGWNEHDLIIDLFMKVKNFVGLIGNHDFIFMDWLKNNKHKFNWSHGGLAVIEAYSRLNEKEYFNTSLGGGNYTTSLTPNDIPLSHIEFFNKLVPYHLMDDGTLLVHAGLNHNHFIEDHLTKNELDVFSWDNSILFFPSKKYKDERIKNVVVGHTTTQSFSSNLPLLKNDVLMIDTGAGFGEMLTLYDYTNNTFYHSTKLSDLYPNQKGRKKHF